MDEIKKIEGFGDEVGRKIANIPGLKTVLMVLLRIALYEFLPGPYKSLGPAIIKSLVSNESLRQKLDEVINDVVKDTTSSSK